MIKIEKTSVYGFEEAIRGMRNPMNSWDKSDSSVCKSLPKEACSVCEERHTDQCHNGFLIGAADLDLMRRLAKNGPVHAKYRRMIVVYADITAPLYWWKEFDTYKVGTVANSCSTMHKIQAKEFSLDDFSYEHLLSLSAPNTDMFDFVPMAGERWDPELFLEVNIKALNHYRDRYNLSKSKEDWWQMIQLLPSSYNQKRTVMMNYEVLSNIYFHRHNHKLDEWCNFCDWIVGLPYSEIIVGRSTETPDTEKTAISEHDRLVISAYTGYLMCDFDELHQFVEEVLGRPVLTHELASEAVTAELREKLKPEWLRICSEALDDSEGVE